MNASIQVELQDFMGNDQAIANAAWTSTYNKDRREDKYDDPDKVKEVVKRLILEGHSTPIESVVFRFWLRIPIYVDRQHMTHRIASHNGLSARYRTMPGDWLSLPEDVKIIADKISPKAGNRLATLIDEELNAAYIRYAMWLDFFKEAEKKNTISNAEYKRAREILRGTLGTAFMVERTSIFNLRSFANYQRLRNSDHAQLEIRQVAELMLREVELACVAPVAIATLKETKWCI